MTDETAVTRFLENPVKLLEHIAETGDFDAGFDYVRVVYDVVSKFDSTLDIVLKGMEDMWKPDEHEGQTFYEAAVRMTPLSPVTIQRHTRVGRMIEQVPESYRPRIQDLDFKSKITIASAVEDDYEISDSQWDRIAGSFSYQDVAEVVREVKNVEPRSQWCRFVVDEDGVVWVKTAHGTFAYYEPKTYENPEIQKVMDWVNEKALRKLGATPK